MLKQLCKMLVRRFLRQGLLSPEFNAAVQQSMAPIVQQIDATIQQSILKGLQSAEFGEMLRRATQPLRRWTETTAGGSVPASEISFQVLRNAPVWMTWSERIVLYSLVFGLRPRRCLEIGTFKGGSALIMCAAMDDVGGDGTLMCIDPNPQVSPENWQKISHRAKMFKGSSPELIGTAALAGGPFDFALIDGDHESSGVDRDIEGTMPVLADQAYMVFHDVHSVKVKNSIRRMLDKYPDVLTECGVLSVEVTSDENEPECAWGGLQMLRFQRRDNQNPLLEAMAKRLFKGEARAAEAVPAAQP